MSNNILKELEEYTNYLNSIPNMKPTYNTYTPIQHSTHIKRRRESKPINTTIKNFCNIAIVNNLNNTK